MRSTHRLLHESESIIIITNTCQLDVVRLLVVVVVEVLLRLRLWLVVELEVVILIVACGWLQ